MARTTALAVALLLAGALAGVLAAPAAEEARETAAATKLEDADVAGVASNRNGRAKKQTTTVCIQVSSTHCIHAH